MNGLDQKPSDPPTVCVRCGHAVCLCPRGLICRVPLCLVQLQPDNKTGLCTYHQKTEISSDE